MTGFYRGEFPGLVGFAGDQVASSILEVFGANHRNSFPASYAHDFHLPSLHAL
jgi:hypothetical protein